MNFLDHKLETDYEKELLTSFELCYKTMRNVKTDPYQWKWVMIFYHNGFQNLMAKELGEDIQLILKPKSASRIVRNIQFNENSKAKWEMDFFMQLVGKLGKLQRYTHSEPYQLLEKEIKALKFLNKFRNIMLHFSEQTYCENISIFPMFLKTINQRCEFILNKSGNILWNDSNKEDSTKIIIKKLSTRLNNLEKYYSLPFQEIPEGILNKI